MHTPAETKLWGLFAVFFFPTLSGVEEVQWRAFWLTCLKACMCLFSFNQKIPVQPQDLALASSAHCLLCLIL